MKIRNFLPICAFLLISISAVNAQHPLKIQFDSSKEVSGKKFAIRDITPNLPTNWNEFNFAVLEFKISTSQLSFDLTTKNFNQSSRLLLNPTDMEKFRIFGINK
jgi:hypothetical protein